MKDLQKFVMRSLAAAVLAFGLVGLMGITPAQAADYTVALTTYVPTASATDFGLGAYPNISTGARPVKLIIANEGATAQNVSVYDTCTSSTAATLAGVVAVSAAIQTVNVDVPERKWKLSSPCFNKSATGSTVQLTVVYE